MTHEESQCKWIQNEYNELQTETGFRQSRGIEWWTLPLAPFKRIQVHLSWKHNDSARLESMHDSSHCWVRFNISLNHTINWPWLGNDHYRLSPERCFSLKAFAKASLRSDIISTFVITQLCTTKFSLISFRITIYILQPWCFHWS